MNFTRTVFAVTAVAAVGFTMTACGPADDGSGHVEPATTGAYGAATDPLSSNGIWTVPEQVAPGRYQVTESSEPVTSLRWAQLCLDEYCDQPRGGAREDMAYGNENRFLVIPDDGSVKAYRNQGVVLTLVP